MPATFLGSGLVTWIWIVSIYAFAASVLPVWTLLQPRDYINAEELIVGLVLLYGGLFVVHPKIVAPAVQLHPTGAPWLVPFLFITIACGAISGFHSLVSSGTSSKQLNNEKDAQFVGYGGMISEGILAAMAIPRLERDYRQEAADSILSHIRYTQHLAMTDDRYDSAKQNWHKERWQISFRKCTGSNNWYYIIGHDLNNGAGIGKTESALNPSDQKYLFSSNTCNLTNDESSEIMITKKFGIENIILSPSCGDNKYIAFDALGRPYKTTLASDALDIITSRCEIQFISGDGDFNISIEPETGYVHLSSINY